MTTEVKDKTDNELIAEFMNDTKALGYLRHPKRLPGDDTKYVKYHESWDWLMPVVEKINETCKSNSKAHYYWNDHEDVRIFRMSLSETFNEVVKFIRWYNANQPKP